MVKETLDNNNGNSEIETKLELSKKLKNKLTEILKQSCVPAEIKSMLDSVRLPNYDIYQQADINVRLPKVFEALLSKEKGLASLELNDIPVVLARITEKIIKKESFDDVILSIGMGGSVDTPNVRCPAYLVSVIKTLDAMHELSETGMIIGTPRVRILKANHLSSQFNDLDIVRVEKVTEMTFEFLRQFVQLFFPHLQDRFEFVIDIEPTQGFLLELEEQVEALIGQEDIELELNAVIEMGRKHGGESGGKKSLLYAAAHPFYNYSITNNGKQPSFIIDYGGRPQSRFNKISRALITQNRYNTNYATPPVVHTIVRAGKVPVYYTARHGDLPLDKDFTTINLSTLDSMIHTDYKEIFSIVDKDEFEDFVKDFVQSYEQDLEQLNQL